MAERERLYPTLKEAKDLERLRKELCLDETEQGRRSGRPEGSPMPTPEAFRAVGHR